MAFEVQKPGPERVRRVFPIPEDPEAYVDIRKLTDDESNRIFDKHKYRPGTEHATMTNFKKVLDDVKAKAIVGYGGFIHEGAEVEYSKLNTLWLMSVRVQDLDGSMKQIWDIVGERVAEQEEEETKNS